MNYDLMWISVLIIPTLLLSIVRHFQYRGTFSLIYCAFLGKVSALCLLLTEGLQILSVLTRVPPNLESQTYFQHIQDFNYILTEIKEMLSIVLRDLRFSTAVVHQVRDPCTPLTQSFT